MFQTYPINSIENISYMFTSKHVYNSKYNDCSLLGISFAYAYRGLIAIIIQKSMPQSLLAGNIVMILDSELKND